ncbi:MAG: hypothetical protein FD156_1105 [Nitrospirae bacterium]|nr:MAG: hypothetical protein FD156_1105 [Nitrospirota bacterium]
MKKKSKKGQLDQLREMADTMQQAIFFSVVIILGSGGALFLSIPEKVRNRLSNSKSIHIRLIGVLMIMIAIAIVIQQMTISSLIHIISGLKNK